MSDQEDYIETSEVFALRKGGNHEMALKHARRNYAGDQSDEWKIKALVWCLYDEIKLLLLGDDIEKLDVTVAELAKIHIPEDDALIKKHISPFLSNSPNDKVCLKASILSKNGKHEEALQLIGPFAKSDAASISIVEAYGRALYRKLRTIDNRNQDVAKRCLNDFSECWSPEWVGNPKLLKYLLKQADRHVNDWAGMIFLVEKMRLDRIKTEEFAEDSDQIPFQDQLLRCIYRCLKRNHTLHGDRPQISALMNAWIESFSVGKFTHYYIGCILLWTGGDRNKARSFLLQSVQVNPDDYWRWRALANALLGNEAIVAFSCAVLGRCENDSHKIPIFVEFAKLLAEEGVFSAAQASLNEARRLRILSGKEWNEAVPVWINEVKNDDLVDIYTYAQTFAKGADELISAEIEPRVCVFVGKLEGEERYRYLCEDGTYKIFKFPVGWKLSLPDGVISARFTEVMNCAPRLLTWEPCQVPDDFGNSHLGVVFEIKKDFVSVTTPLQSFIPIHFDHRRPKAQSLEVGDCMHIRWMKLKNGKSHILFWEKIDRIEVPDFFIPVTGLFAQAPDQAYGYIHSFNKQDRDKLIDCENSVFVPPVVAQRLKRGQEIQGWAVLLKDQHRGYTWRLVVSHP